MVERLLIKEVPSPQSRLASQFSFKEQRCLLYRIYDPQETNAPVVPGPNDQFLTVAEAFRLHNLVSGASFLKSQKIQIKDKEINAQYQLLLSPNLPVYGRVQAATELLTRTPQKWMSKGVLTLLGTLGVSDKPE